MFSNRALTPEPMSFSSREFWSAALRSVVVFVALVLLVVVGAAVIGDITSPPPGTAQISQVSLLVIVLPVAAISASAVALLVMVLAHPMFRVIGNALRNEKRLRIHMLVYAGAGAVLGAIVMIGVFALLLAGQSIGGSPGAVLSMAAFGAVLTAIAIPTGWYWAYRRWRVPSRPRRAASAR